MDDAISRKGVSAWLENMGYSYPAKVIMDEKRFPSVLGTNLAEVGTDLISRTEAIEDVKSWEAVDGREKHLQKNVVEWLKELPSAQPDIIRCKDCKNWDTTWTNDFSPNYHYCPMVDGVRKEDWYCADAERRTE